MARTAFLVLATVLLGAAGASAAPLFPNSVASNDIDFIRADDPRVGHCLVVLGAARREMPDPRRDELFVDGVPAFAARYVDGTEVELWAHPDLGEDGPALAEAVAERVGHLPRAMRDRLGHVVLLTGDEPAFAEHLGRFFVLHAGNAARRIADGDLEETVFHESVHATLDAEWLGHPDWLAAQRSDGAFVTDYAAERPEQEDMAESALFAYAAIVTPGRLPAEVEAELRRIMPARLAFFERLFPTLGPARVDLPAAC